MDREGFRNRLKQYKEARGLNPLLKYWDWKLKYDSAPQSDSMPSQPQPDLPTVTSQPLDDRAHRWDNGYSNVNRDPFDSPYDDARYHDYRKPRIELRKGNVYYSNPNYLKWMGGFGKVLRGGSILGEAIPQLFPSEEAELIEDLRIKMNKQNKWLTGLEDIPKYDEGTDLIGKKEIQWFKDWYNKRMEYAIANNRPDIVKQLESLLYNFYPESYKYSLGVDWDNSIYTGTLDPRINGTKISINDQAIKDYEKKHGVKIGGYLHPSEGIVLPSNYNSNDLLHELAHTFNYTESVTNAINSAISDENGFVTIPEGLQNPEYWISPWEVHSRLMLFREENNIDPTKVYNEEDVKQLRKSAKDKILFEIFNDSQMMHLLNDVADNATTPTDDRLFLKNGGVVPKYEGGTDNVLSNLQDDNQLKYKSSNVKYNTDPSTFTKNLYNRIAPIPALMPDGPIIDGIKSYFNNADNYVEETFSEEQLGILDVERFNEFKKNIENVINRQGYAEAMEPFILEDSKDIYLNMPQRFNTYEISEFKPKGAENKTYYKNKFLEEVGTPLLLDVVKDIKTNTIVPHSYWMDYGRAYKITKNKNAVAVLPGYGNATVGSGIDSKKGEYVSYYDKWDVGRFSPNTKHPLDYFYDPVNVYGRVYLDDYYGVNSAPNKGDYYGGYLPEVEVKPKKYKEGGEVTGPPTYEDWLKSLIKNDLWMHPDYYMAHSLNTATKVLKLASTKLPGREDIPPVPVPAEIKGEFPQEWVMNNLYNVENPRKKGVTKKYAKMYDSRTLGAGVDVVSGHSELYDKAKRFGIERELADKIAYEHIAHDDQVIRDNYADIYGKAAADTLSFGPRFLVAQARYQLGNVRKGWDEIHKALAKGDAKALKKAVLKVTPEDHDYRKKWIKNFNVYGNEPE